MKKFTDAIKGAWKNITHHHKGLPPTHTATPIEEEAAAKVSETVVTKKPHRKHKHQSKPRGKVAPITVVEENPVNLPVEAATKELTDAPVSAVASNEKSDVVVNSQPEAVAVAVATDPGPRTKLSEVVLMLGEKNADKAAHASAIIENRRSRELIYSAEGVDLYGLQGRSLPTEPHRLDITSQGLHYLTTQEAVDEMNQSKQGPRGKVAPQRRA